MRRITLTVLLLALCGGCLLPAGCTTKLGNEGSLWLSFGTTLEVGTRTPGADDATISVELHKWIQEEIKERREADDGTNTSGD